MTELVRRLDRRRWAVHVACFRAEGAWRDRVLTHVSSVAEFPITRFADHRTAAQMRAFARWCRHMRVRLVHTSELYTNIFFLPAAAMAAVPVRIGSRREIAAGKSRAQIALQRLAYSFAHRVLANAGAAAERLRREQVSPDRITVIPNGLDLTRYEPRVLPPTLRRIVVVANLRPGKGHDVIIDAAPAVLARFPDARFAFVGDGTERARLEQRVVDRGLSRAIAFHGHTDDVAAHLRESDVFTLPSESEAFPNAVLEAMAAGLPVVTSAVGGILEVVNDDRTGVLVAPRDPAALADALCGVMADPDRARRLAEAGRALVEARYSFDRMVSSVEALYERELSHRAPEAAMQSEFASL
jgi:glycosyltransferase involved in cell wall biosynthesis